ncbi:hypothetical protein [Chitinophaga nivalis]|uniref:Uncharacterized protein n=1 Tax=Chitinophaga nivalis TaxID=2991709 RepID=A0ABT3IIV2_9BACT|nr:hypothetical protein [Chitinophaga nivalis]MCW3466409.1 hypothetical protein [Chitinophaga nivalis]MCW3483900.1 hypothetical protein [Chitinophaga nivalis]
MFGLFEKKYNNPTLIEEMAARQERWFVFLEKLEARMEEVSTAALPELRHLFEEDTDPYKRAHGRMLAGLLGQINEMRTKANTVRTDSIIDFVTATECSLPQITSRAGREYYDRLFAFKMACFNRHDVFEEKIHEAITLLQGAAGEEDLEAAYQEQLAAFERIRDKYCCKQCGGNISIPKMFFIATYIPCPFCQSQNTFMPSTGARMVLGQARSLAEQRTAHLLRRYEASNPRQPDLYRQYLRAMFDEWNKIVPDMAAENEKFHQRLLNDYTNHHL